MLTKIPTLQNRFEKHTSGSSRLDSIPLALFAKLKEQIVSPTSFSHGLTSTSIKTFEPSPIAYDYKKLCIFDLTSKADIETLHKNNSFLISRAFLSANAQFIVEPSTYKKARSLIVFISHNPQISIMLKNMLILKWYQNKCIVSNV
jgi:hypothetical protein